MAAPKLEPLEPLVQPVPRSGLQFLDFILRNEQMLFEQIRLERDLPRLAVNMFCLSTLLLAIYGWTMGLQHSWLQSVAAMGKVPVLFIATLVICLPSLYVFNVVLGSRLKFGQTATLLLTAVTVTSMLAASLATISLFFLLTGRNYHFLILLHVTLLGISGFYGVAFMYRGLKYLCEKIGVMNDFTVFRLWMLIYAFVGVQMSWVLKPFIGDPSRPLALLRPIEGNFFLAVFRTAMHLFNVQLPPNP